MALSPRQSDTPPLPKMSGGKMFLQRAIIALTLGPLALVAVYLGGWFYFLPLVAILLLATLEYVHITRAMGWRASHVVMVPVVLLQLIIGQWYTPATAGAVLVVSLLVIIGYTLLLYERHQSTSVPMDLMAMVLGLVLLGWVGSHFFRLRGLPEMAWQWTMLALVGTWVTDSSAYVVGRFLAGRVLGRHQLSPRLSPNKTIEGYMGGVILGTAVTMGLAYYLQVALLPALVIALLITIVSPLGDLTISLLKREAGIKDSGTIFKGHGGALDRVDSLLWSVTMAYYVVLLLA